MDDEPEAFRNAASIFSHVQIASDRIVDKSSRLLLHKFWVFLSFLNCFFFNFTGLKINFELKNYIKHSILRLEFSFKKIPFTIWKEISCINLNLEMKGNDFCFLWVDASFIENRKKTQINLFHWWIYNSHQSQEIAFSQVSSLAYRNTWVLPLQSFFSPLR